MTQPFLSCPSKPGLHIVRVRYPKIPLEATVPRTHVLAAGAGPDQIREVIAGILGDWS
ncbi:MAG TPA: hypothetical protein VFQ44_03085 [Streptosporangiaceae bacterium]|nr:hypothetical protein [Streptosporangiaceae bacterium]